MVNTTTDVNFEGNVNAITTACLNSTAAHNVTVGDPVVRAPPAFQLPVFLTGTVSMATYTEFLVYYSKLALVTCVVGVACSALNVWVYLHQQGSGGGVRPRKKDVYVSFLVGIAVCDGLFTLSKAIGYVIALMPPKDSAAIAYSDLIIDIYAASAFRRAAVWLNALASLERFLTIAFPLGTASYIFKRAPDLVIVCFFVATCAVHVSKFFEFTVVKKSPEVWIQTTSEQRQADPDLFILTNNVTRIIFFYVPLFGSLVVNLALMVALKRHAVTKKSMTTSRGGISVTSDGDVTSQSQKKKAEKETSSTEAQAAKLILILTLTFFFLALPSTLNATIASFHPEYGVPKKEMLLYALVLYCFNFPMFLTQAVVFFVSLGYSSRFRAVCAQHLRVRRGGRHKYRDGQSATGSEASSANTTLSSVK